VTLEVSDSIEQRKRSEGLVSLDVGDVDDDTSTQKYQNINENAGRNVTL
jgi:hypothetical protein